VATLAEEPVTPPRIGDAARLGAERGDQAGRVAPYISFEM